MHIRKIILFILCLSLVVASLGMPIDMIAKATEVPSACSVSAKIPDQSASYTVVAAPHGSFYPGTVAGTSANVIGLAVENAVSMTSGDSITVTANIPPDQQDRYYVYMFLVNEIPIVPTSYADSGYRGNATLSTVITGDTTIVPYFEIIGDLNLDGHVDILDLNIMLSVWNVPDPQVEIFANKHIRRDINRDGTVGIGDVSLLLGNYNTQWTIVTFDKNAGTTEASPASISTNYNTTVTLPTPPAKTGYIFASWNTIVGGTGTTFTGASPVIASITVYAQWTINAYTVTFNSQGGTNVASQGVNYGTLVTKPADPTYTGHTFVNWYKESTYTNLWSFTADTVTSATTLYAKWTLDIINISTAGVTGFVAPAKGAVPIAIGVLNANAATYTKTSLVWAPTDNPYLLSTSYIATVVLTSASGYKFPAGGLTPTVNTGTPAAGTVGGGDVSGNTLTFTVTFPATAGLAIGDSYGGGKIAYIDGSGIHGLIAAAADQSTGIYWHVSRTGTTGAVATAIGTGNANTNAIVALYGAESNAARICYDLSLNGYTDWYLPSYDELNQLYINRVAVGGFASDLYFSSSEYGSENARYQNFAFGFSNYVYKESTLYVRAVRSF